MTTPLRESAQSLIDFWETAQTKGAYAMRPYVEFLRAALEDEPEQVTARALQQRIEFLEHHLSRCRDAFPVPTSGSELEDLWRSAMQTPDGIPAFVEAAMQAGGKVACKQYQDSEGIWHGFSSARHEAAAIADGRWPVRTLYTHPQPKAQDAGRKHLTDEQIERDRPMMVEPAAYAAGIRYAEKYHGITAQQGEKT